jgi:hypothetical protein
MASCCAILNIQQNLFNLICDNLEILIIWHLRRVVPRLEVLLFTTKKCLLMKEADLRHIIKKASKIVCTSTIVVSPHLLSPTPSASSAMKTPENAEDTRM